MKPDSVSTLELLEAVLGAPSLRDGAERLAACISAQAGADRVTIGICQPDGKLALAGSAPSGVGHLPAELAGLLEGAMLEALDQAVSVALPSPPEHRNQTIQLEHEALRRLAGGAIATVPLGRGGEPIGAICLERRRTEEGPVFSVAELAGLEDRLAPLAPALWWLARAECTALARARETVVTWAGSLRQPERRTRRFAIAACCAGAAFVFLVPLQDPVSGLARLEGEQQRVLSAPADGFIQTAHVRPGDQVRAGDVLVDLLDADLRLESERWRGQLAQHETAYAAAMAKGDRVAAATSIARIGEAQAQLSLIEQQIARGRVTAPFDGQVIQGDWSQAVGAPVRQGDALVTLATQGRHRVIVQVDETDIARVRAGQAGRLALSALPWQHEELVVERVSPLAKVVDGHNVYEVQARLADPHAELRPGLLGRAELTAGRTPLAWSLLRHTALRVRVALWSWLA